jgi:hypothetical protein
LGNSWDFTRGYGLRYNDKAIALGAQTERRGVPGR